MLASDSNVIIIGAGQAGFQTAASLRERGFEGRIVLIGDEAGLPYQRPPLSKAYLKPETLDAQLHFRNASFFPDRQIELCLPERAVTVDRTTHRVELASRGDLYYEHLVLATGARPRLPAWPGMELRGAFFLRTMEDARRIRAQLQTSVRIVIVGAGFIGLEVASSACVGNRRVTIVEFADRPLKRAVSSEMGKYVLRAHASRGVEFLMQTSVASIKGIDGRVAGVITEGGREIEADLVLIGIGVRPNTELAEAAGLLVDDGIVVDTYLLTSDPMISAIGDCARYPSVHSPSRVRLESVQNSIEQARTVAARLMGKKAPYDKLPCFWSDQGDLRMLMCGLAEETDDAVLRGDPETGQFSILRFRGSRLTAIESVNHSADHMAMRKILASGEQLVPNRPLT